MNEVSEGNAAAHDVPPCDQHAHRGIFLEYYQRLNSCAHLYGPEACLGQHFGSEHTQERDRFRDEEGNRSALDDHRAYS